jgi:hypothetical protein
MLKATKLTLAAALLAGSCGLAMAQGAGGGGGAGSDRIPSTEAHPGGNPTSGTAPTTAPMKQQNTGMQTPTSARGQETGTAPDSAGTGAMHKAPGTNNQK